LINLGTSAPNTYTVTYNFSDGTCSNTTTSSVTVNALPVATISGGSFCKTGTTQLNVTSGPTNGTFSAVPSGLNISSSGLINLGASAAAVYTVTYSFSNGTCSNTATSSVTVKSLPTASISVSAQSCNGGVAQFTLTATTNGSITWSTNGDGSFSSTTSSTTTYTAGNNDKSKGATITLSTGLNGCSNSATTVLKPAACGPFYTYTQGYYSGTGTSCTPIGGFKNSVSLIQYAIDNMDGIIDQKGTLYLGKAGASFSATYTDASALKKIMPGGGTATKLVKDYDLATSTSAPAPPLKNGKIDNVLLSQTITLDMNIHIQGDALGSFVLRSGFLTTQKGDASTCPIAKPLSCTKDASSISSLKLTSNTTLMNLLNGKTINDLFNMASAALGGTLPSGVTYTDINNAVDVINKSFDAGRFFWGYYSTQQTCTTFSSSITSVVSTTMNKTLSVSAYPNPYNNTVNFHFTSPQSGKATLVAYDLTGKKLAIIFEGNVNSGSEYNLKYNVAGGNRVSMIYKLTIGNFTYHGLLIPEK